MKRIPFLIMSIAATVFIFAQSNIYVLLGIGFVSLVILWIIRKPQ